MFGNGRKTIGVIISDVALHYQEHICQILSSYAQTAGYNLAYFSSYTCYGDSTTLNGRGEANIVRLVPYDELDALIVCQDTLRDGEVIQYVWKSIEEKCNCPVITLRQDSGKYPCVLVDASNCIEQMVYHFVDEHHKTKFGFMSGPFEHPDAIKRLNEFKRALANRGIPYDDKLVFEGDFWRKKGKEAANYFTLELDECPEVIICANDYMANALMNELIDKGISVPEDIAVSGFDDIWEASITMPPITTVTVPVDEIAEMAIKKIEKIWAGEEVERITTVNAKLVIRNSCGCKKIGMQSMLTKRVRQAKEFENLLECNQDNIYFMIDLSNMDSIDGIENHLRFNEFFGNHISNLFICLGEGRGNKYPKYHSTKLGFAEKSKAVGGLFHKRSISTEIFQTHELLPKEATECDPMIYYFFPLHSNEYSLGYIAISFRGIASVGKSFHYWLAILGNAIETIRIKQRNQGLLAELNNLYIHDSLTGLYNRRGFDYASEDLYSSARRDRKSFIIFAIDMDNLKIVNDKFGHMNGDLALKTIGTAMCEAAKNEDVCARVGGDEYNVIGLEYTKEEADKFVENFYEYLNKFNETSELPYLINASVGYYLLEQGEQTSLEQCIVAADESLYEHKRKRKEDTRYKVLREEEV